MSDLRFCPACGMQLPRVAGVPVRFCPGCGVRLESVEDDPGVTEHANGAAADDGAGEGYEPSANAPVDVPMQDADAASPVRDVAAADAPASATLSSTPHAMPLAAKRSRKWRCRGVGVSKRRILSAAVVSTARFQLA